MAAGFPPYETNAMILTYQQFMDQEYVSLRAEYPDAEPKEIREMVQGASRRQDWVDDVTARMRIGTPSRQQWPHIVRELGAMYIWRRVFHDAPGTDARYLAAGLVLPQIAAKA